jgi:hypothetical protein
MQHKSKFGEAAESRAGYLVHVAPMQEMQASVRVQDPMRKVAGYEDQ